MKIKTIYPVYQNGKMIANESEGFSNAHGERLKADWQKFKNIFHRKKKGQVKATEDDSDVGTNPNKGYGKPVEDSTDVGTNPRLKSQSANIKSILGDKNKSLAQKFQALKDLKVVSNMKDLLTLMKTNGHDIPPVADIADAQAQVDSGNVDGMSTTTKVLIGTGVATLLGVIIYIATRKSGKTK